LPAALTLTTSLAAAATLPSSLAGASASCSRSILLRIIGTGFFLTGLSGTAGAEIRALTGLPAGHRSLTLRAFMI
jgi:hypothetical protein